MVNLNLGCGSVRPSGWINTDSSLNANIQRIPFLGSRFARYFSGVQYENHNVVYMNLNKKWKFSSDSVDIVYASHLFEHLSLPVADMFFNEAYRCLKPGGTIRIVVPDLYKICKQYLEDYSNQNIEDPTTFIMWAINMHREGQYGMKIPWWKKKILEYQRYPHQHKYMYDDRSLSRLFAKKGFININSHEYGKSSLIKNIFDVEGTKESYLSVYIEGQKP